MHAAVIGDVLRRGAAYHWEAAREEEGFSTGEQVDLSMMQIVDSSELGRLSKFKWSMYGVIRDLEVTNPPVNEGK